MWKSVDIAYNGLAAAAGALVQPGSAPPPPGYLRTMASSDILASSRPGHLLSLDTGHEEAGVAQGENIQWCPGSSSEQVVKDYLFFKKPTLQLIFSLASL